MVIEKQNAVFVIISIRGILQIPVFFVEFQGDDADVFPGGAARIAFKS